MLSENKAVKLFTEVLDHVVTLRLSMHKQVEADSLLEADDGFDFLLDELLVLFFGEFTLSKLGTGLTDLLGLLLK